jgi:broad specificity phosphatase PhoE
VAERFPAEWATWSTSGGNWDIVPGGEGSAVFEKRVAAAMDAILERHGQGDVLVVTHGGVIQMTLNRVVGRASLGLFPFKIQNASITVVEKRGGRFIIAGVNDTSHLDPALVAEPGTG